MTKFAPGYRRRPLLLRLFLILVFLVVILLLHQAILLIQFYWEYIVAVMVPEPPLPLQKRPQEAMPLEDKGEPPRILCLITTSPQHHEGRAKHVAVTWARHCSLALFLTSAHDPRLPKILLTPAAAYDQLWTKVTQGFEWAYEHRDQFDWVVKADDDTFILVENLQAAVRTLDPDQPQATGVHLRTWDTGSTYLNGGAGYVLSRGAVTTLVEQGLRANQCQHHLHLGNNEDVNMALCLTYLGVVLLDSRDAAGRQRFHVYPPHELVDPRQANNLRHLWLKQISVFPYQFGFQELSQEVISFHYVDAETMYFLYYLIYHVNPTSTSRVPFQPIGSQPRPPDPMNP